MTHPFRRGARPAILTSILLLTVACSSPVVEPQITRPSDIEVEVVATGLVGPTQIVPLEDGTIIAGVISGGESDSVGQIVSIGPGAGQTTVLYEGLDRPTGVAILDDHLFVLEATRLSRGPVGGGALTIVAEDLPNNGRSQGTLTITDDGALIFNTSGSRRGGTVKAGSGRLWALDPADGDRLEELADGFKNAYAHVIQGETVWTTEVGDGSFDGLAPADEVVRLPEQRPTSGGWPRCVGDNRPVAELGMAAEDCEGFPPSLAVFEPGATPTGIVMSPFEEGRLLVALWVTGQIGSVPIDGEDPSGWTVWASGLRNPQHLAVLDGELYVSEFGADRILKFSQK